MVDFNENVLHRRGDEGRDHIPAVPFWVAIIRAFQFVCDSLSFEEKCPPSTGRADYMYSFSHSS
jgi:hypothetical protein